MELGSYDAQGQVAEVQLVLLLSSLQPAQANGRLQIPGVPNRFCSQTPAAIAAGSQGELLAIKPVDSITTYLVL